VQRASKISRDLSEDKITYLARQRAQYWSGRIDGYLQVLRTISNEMNYYENVKVDERRAQYEATMISVFEDQPDFVRMFTVWKPNALDGMDNRYIGRPGSTDTGQFAFALGRETGQIVPQTSQVVQSVMEYISGPNARIETVDHPAVMTLMGKDVYVVRLMIPIINKRLNEVVGAVGCQLNIDLIQPRLDTTLKSFEEVAAIGVYSSNGFILGSYRPERIGKMMVDAEVQFGSYVNEAFEAVKA
jgi:methyl-accepting chemotaxis protein